MPAIALHRLYTQRLAGTPFDSPEEAVAWLGAVQAQDYPGAKWALGQRTGGLSDADLDRAFNEGKILRTHVMRPTWHFVIPADIRWLLELTAPRVHAFNAYMYRKAGLDESLLKLGSDVLAKALEGGKFLMRAELGAALEEAGIPAEGVRLGYIIHYAELEAVVCSGPRKGKQFTYALLDERAPHALCLNREEALVELTRRYFTGHGPATVHDFAWWSGLSVTEAKTGVEMVKSILHHAVIDDETYWFVEAPPSPAETDTTRAYLLPTYDEFVIGYTDRSAMFEAAGIGGAKAPQSLFPAGSNLAFDSVILYESQVIGTWRRAFKKGAAVIETRPLTPTPFTAAQTQTIAAAATRFGDFLKMPVVMA